MDSEILKPKLTLLQERFVAEYKINGGNATQAYISAGGPSTKNPRKVASNMLRHPSVRAALAEARKEIREKSQYDAVAAMNECDMLMNEARQANQYTAASSLLATKAKIAGLIDKHQTPIGFGFQINITGIEAPKAPPVIEIKGIEVKKEPDDGESRG